MATPQTSSWQRYRRYYQQLEKVAGQPQTRVYSTAVFSFLAASLFGLYAILPTMRTIFFLRREIADKTQVNKQMEDKITALIESQAAYEEAGDNLSLVSEAIPEAAKAVELALTVRNLSGVVAASTSALQIASVPLVGGEATTAAQPSKAPASFPITVITSGSYLSLKSFLDGLLSLKRLVTIESIRFTPATELIPGTPTGGALQLVLQLKAYYQNL